MTLEGDELGLHFDRSAHSLALSRNPHLLVSGPSFNPVGLIPTTQDCLQASEW